MSHSLAFLGAGPLAQPYLDVLRKRDDVQIAAVCDQDRRAAEQIAAGWGAKVFPSCQSMLQDSQADALWICVPARLQSEAVGLAIERRVPFFACPPGATDFASAQRHAEAVDKARLVSAVGFTARDADVVQEAREYLGANVVPLALGWWLHHNGEDGAEGALEQLWTQACVSLDAMRLFCGEVERVRAITPGVANSAAPARGLVLQLEFVGGTVGMLTCATFARPEPRIELELLGEIWSLRFGRDLETLRLDERDKTTILRCLSDPISRQTSAFLQAVSDRNPASVSVSYAEALRTMAVCHAAEISVRESRAVELSEEAMNARSLTPKGSRVVERSETTG